MSNILLIEKLGKMGSNKVMYFLRLTLVIFCIIFGSHVGVRGDTIVLKNTSNNLELKIVGVTSDYISAVIPKKLLTSLNMQFSNTGKFSDLISLRSDTSNIALECEVKEITQDNINVLIPISLISSLKMSFQKDSEQTKTVFTNVDSTQVVEDVSRKADKNMHEKSVVDAGIRNESETIEPVDEIRTDIKEKKDSGKNFRLKSKKKKPESLSKKDEQAVFDNEEAEDENKNTDVEQNQMVVNETTTKSGEAEKHIEGLQENKEISKGIKNITEEGKPVIQDMNLGNVKGRILHGGNLLPNCQVKLQMLEKSGLLTKGYRPVEGALELETVTDKDGRYHFVNVSPGLYKLHWKPQDETTWIRRFKMDPDVIVEPGKTTNPKDVEILKRTLN